MRKILRTAGLVLTLTFFLTMNVCAFVYFTEENQESGYEIVMADHAELLGEDDAVINPIYEQMKRVSAFGNAALLTADENSGSAGEMAKKIYRDWFGTESGCLFLIDMDNRQLHIFCDGAVYKTINKSIAVTITDNVYRYASDGDYAGCVKEAFSQIAVKLEGGRIAAPMRYLSAFFLAMLLSLIITFIRAKRSSHTEIAEEADLMKGLYVEQRLYEARRILVKREMRIKSSDSGGGSGSSGGGGGGSGSSGGGGGHGF